MATAKKLPSGNWRVRVGDGKGGKSKSFTAPTKKEAELMALEYANGRNKPQNQRTISECVDEYIAIKSNVLSPTTIYNYKKLKNNYYTDIGMLRLCDLTSPTAQAWVNKLAIDKSPKTVRNAYGLLSAVISTYRPDFALRVSLPQKQKQFREYPEVSAIINTFKGSEIEIPVLLALWQGMRMSEIRGVKKSDIKNGVLTIHSVVVTVDGEHVEKEQTKTYSSARQLRLPQYILDLIAELPAEQEYITTLSGQAIYKRFVRTLEQNGIQHIRFHDLRHLNASVMLSLGIPDKYAMERGGWSSPHIMQSTYQHTFTAERDAVDQKINAYFNGLQTQ